MGAVFKATQLSLDRPVALKLLSQHLSDDAQFLERFHREADVLSRLTHPNVVTVIDRGEVGGRPYLVMEYVEGTNLRQVMSDGPLPAGEALKVVSSVLAALEHAHAQGIVHRDIKPENVLLAQGGIVKVADFGLSRLLGPEDRTRLTRTNIALGTYEYMAPEQREKAQDADERSDLYAAGVVLYEMLTAELPIGRFALPSRRRPDECDARIDRIIEKSLEKDPEERYQNARAMGDAVSQVLDRPSATETPEEPASTEPATLPGGYAAVRFENHLRNLASIDRVIATLLFFAGLVWTVLTIAMLADYSMSNAADWASFALFGIMLALFLGGFFFWRAATLIRKNRMEAVGLQLALASIAALTVVLIPFTVYSFLLLWGHRGRAYFEARSRGKSPEEAAQQVYTLERGESTPQQQATRATNLPSNYRPVRLEYRVHILAGANRILAGILALFVPIWIWGWLSTVTYTDPETGISDHSKGWIESATSYASEYPLFLPGLIGVALLALFLACGLMATSRKLRAFDKRGLGHQSALAVLSGLTLFLLPFAIYSFSTTFGLKFRTYYEARARGLSPDAAASECYGLLEGSGAEAHGQ